MKMIHHIYIVMCAVCSTAALSAQNNVGLNTASPSQAFEMSGSGHQYLRLHHTATSSTRAELELLRGAEDGPGRDWKLSKVNNDLRFLYDDNNFQTFGTEVMRFQSDGKVGIGTTSPQTKLHITGGENGTNTDDGYLVLGAESSVNLVMDNNAILSRNNGVAAGLYLQGDGGNTHFGYSGLTNTIVNNGKVSIGGYSTNARLNVDDDLWQLQLNNFDITQNNWFIGASNASWIVGDDQLVFSPTSSSSDAMFRLMDVADNDGNTAPVMIRSAGGHTLLMDGNEIDGKTAPLYFNYNSEEDIYLNAQGGKVGIGTNQPEGFLHIYSPDVSGYSLTLENGTARWQMTAHVNRNMYFFNQGILRAYIHFDGGGTWVQASDRKFKENIRPLTGAMDLIRKTSVKQYTYVNDPDAAGDFGVIAQEIAQVIPEAVFEEEGRAGVNYDQITCVALEGVKEQQARIEALSGQIDQLLQSLEADKTSFRE